MAATLLAAEEISALVLNTLHLLQLECYESNNQMHETNIYI